MIRSFSTQRSCPAKEGATAPIAILGMHRSGTSCLAGCLEECGLVLGTVNRAAPHNRKGNNENEAMRAVHMAILERHGHAWDNPPGEALVWTDAERAAMHACIAEYDAAATWGFKDPRSLFLLEGWLDLIPGLRFVGSFRHPLETAASLTRRDGFSTEKGLALWQAYNEAMLAWHARDPFPIVFYDADADRYLASVRKAAAALGLDATAPITFREEGLVHNLITDPPPAHVAELWERLHAVSIQV